MVTSIIEATAILLQKKKYLPQKIFTTRIAKWEEETEDQSREHSQAGHSMD
jgi:hypothetical protein